MENNFCRRFICVNLKSHDQVFLLLYTIFVIPSQISLFLVLFLFPVFLRVEFLHFYFQETIDGKLFNLKASDKLMSLGEHEMKYFTVTVHNSLLLSRCSQNCPGNSN